MDKEKIMMRIIMSCIALLMLSACTFDILPRPNFKDYVKNADGSIVSNCNGGGFFKDSPKRLENFWKDNNLPYGTLDYRCKDGKPYMPDSEELKK
jgi:hypothetical protein